MRLPCRASVLLAPRRSVLRKRTLLDGARTAFNGPFERVRKKGKLRARLLQLERELGAAGVVVVLSKRLLSLRYGERPCRDRLVAALEATVVYQLVGKHHDIFAHAVLMFE